MRIKLSNERFENSNIQLDNLFVMEYMPFAPENFVKIYLYGLSMASRSDDDNVDTIAKKLGIDKKLVMEAYKYWESEGLVNITETTPPGVEYLRVRPLTQQIKKFKKEKYKSFNEQLHAMLPNRNFLPNEYNEYYNIIETLHIEIEAMLTIIAYCVRLKGEEITYPYIIAVARNLAHEGCVTFDKVQERLSEYNLYDKDLGEILKTLKLRRTPDHDDKRLFNKWTKKLGFSLETIIHAAKLTKKGGMQRLDALLTKYYENHLPDAAAIDDYNKMRDKLYALTKDINKIIGVYYEQLDYIIENYTVRWLGYGFDHATLITLAGYCFKHNIRTIEGMNEVVLKFYKQGIISIAGIDSFIKESLHADDEIKSIMDKAGVSRKLTSWDRDYYRTWTYSWKMPSDVIEYAAELSAGKANPFAYMNTILAGWNNSNIRSLNDAKNTSAPASTANNRPKEIKSASRNYTAEELNAMFDRLNPEDI